MRAVLTGALQESDGTTYNVATQMNSFVYNTVVGWCASRIHSCLDTTFSTGRGAVACWALRFAAFSCHICAECTAGFEVENLQCSLAARSRQRSNPNPGSCPCARQAGGSNRDASQAQSCIMCPPLCTASGTMRM